MLLTINPTIQRLRAQLTWDSRQQFVIPNVRGIANRHYRLLYASNELEVELYVESHHQERRMRGELLPLPVNSSRLPALVQIQDSIQDRTIHELESDFQGNFHIDSLKPGMYNVLITPQTGSIIELSRLELS